MTKERLPKLTTKERALLEEFSRREAQKEKVLPVIEAIRAELFQQQLDFMDDPSRNKAACTTRRAGKTSMWVRYTTSVALLHPSSLMRIWGITRLRAKQLLWDEFQKLFARHKIKVKLNETELSIKFDNGSEIRLVGADKDKEAEKKRGDKTRMEIVMEAQLFTSILKKLVEDIAEPCLFDLKGTFCLEGTPGLVCAGYWYNVSGEESVAHRWTSKGSKKDGEGAGWSLHHWSVLDNPFLPDAREELRIMKAKRRWTDDNPTYIREWLGRWVNDFGALFYKFDPVRNIYNPEKIKPWGPGWEHILGWDLGFRDDMALVAWGYHPEHPCLYEAFSWKQPGALSADVMEQVHHLEKRGPEGVPLNFIRKFADTGGGGKMYVEDVIKRYGEAFEPAKKTEKYEHVRLLNDDLLGGFVLLRPGSPLALEMAELPKDPDWPPEDKPEAPPREHPQFANHCCDAGLYSWRGGWHYLHEKAKEVPRRGSSAWFEQETKAMENAVMEKKQRRESLYEEENFQYDTGDESYDDFDSF